MHRHPVTARRGLLQAAAAGVVVLACPWTAASQAPMSHDPFTLGVASGSPAADSIVLWTRLLDDAGAARRDPAPVAVRWELAHDEQFSRVVQRGEAVAQHELAHSVHVEVAGLESDRWYFYRFIAGGIVSRVGRTRTLPAPDAAMQALRVTYASCQRWEHGYFSAYRHMREENPDAVLFLGDYVYEYPGAARAVRVPPGGWVLTLDDYRSRYALHKGEADLQAMHAACPWIVTWDDHEVQNDYAGAHAGEGGPPVADFPARRAAAYQAFYEHMPMRATALTRALVGLTAGAEMRLYSRYRFGRLATLHLLDTRQYRDQQPCTPKGKPGSGVVDPQACPSWEDPARTLLGSAQERWLDQGLSVAREGWSVIAQQTLFGARDLQPAAGASYWNDGWDGYAAARSRLTASLERHRVGDAVLFGGDVHENWVGHVKADYRRPESASLGVEFCGTSLTSRSAGNDKLPQRLAANPHFVFADSERRGYGVADFTPDGLTTKLRVVDDVARPDTRIQTLAAFHVQSGRPRIERA
jgi:alkaline phosphatase D